MKLGFIGAGFVARFQAVAVHQVRGLEITGILKRRGAEALAGFCRSNRLGDAVVYNSIADMAKHVDAMALYVPNYACVETTEEIAAAVKSGARLKGVIREKPLGRNMKEARRLAALAKECGPRTAYFENQIYMKAIAPQPVAAGAEVDGSAHTDPLGGRAWRATRTLVLGSDAPGRRRPVRHGLP
jgi:predicted dehydrogenase